VIEVIDNPMSLQMTVKQKKSRIFSSPLFVVKDIKKGEVFTEENIKSIKPECGLKPKYLKDGLRERAKRVLVKERRLILIW